ncbi:hypothetical protein THASP1DRAFT_21929 [Thamnocephalis sphaerospora]|uniref:DNA polymerase delta subunit 3 n=1 Tax=Thamnocephalis sphaerospora TaxID=78915 RepID=A0A4V1IXA2_9FUNG|nr:hypothetical protein THASP1DRAFT_21929 [Thamnocephalis sphaerospora]|eukprot:RKP10349.1 hypothetical protein THASP1DRAFT_21929 [Thamnocephalis sphaerospora]
MRAAILALLASLLLALMVKAESIDEMFNGATPPQQVLKKGNAKGEEMRGYIVIFKNPEAGSLDLNKAKTRMDATAASLSSQNIEVDQTLELINAVSVRMTEAQRTQLEKSRDDIEMIEEEKTVRLVNECAMRTIVHECSVSASNHEAQTLLETWVLEEKRMVTFQMLAIQLSIDANTAKRCVCAKESVNNGSDGGHTCAHHATAFYSALYAFAQSELARTQDATEMAVDDDERPHVACVYCVSGIAQPSTAGGAAETKHAATARVFRLVTEDALEATKAGMATVTGVHVYSVGPCKPSNADTIGAAATDYMLSQAAEATRKGVPLGVRKFVMATPTHGASSSPFTGAATKQSASHTTAAKRTAATASASKPRDASTFFAGHAKRPPKPATTISAPDTAAHSSVANTGTKGDGETAAKHMLLILVLPQSLARKRRIVDESDEDVDGVPEEAASDNETEDTPVAAIAVDAVGPETSGKRKRGRRRVARQKTYKNERGYFASSAGSSRPRPQDDASFCHAS